MKIGLAVATVCLMSSSAFAGVFVGLGVGTGPEIGGTTSQSKPENFESSARSKRIEGGYAFPVLTGHLAIEGAYTNLSTYLNDPNHTFDSSRVWLAARYNHPLGSGFEIFGRLGVQNTKLDDNNTSHFSGTGPVLGLGAELHPQWKLGVDLSFWIDLNYAKETLTTTGHPDVDASDHIASLGVSVGF
jgi:hypothetical protein